MAWGTALWRRMRVFLVAFNVFFDYRSMKRKVNGSKDEKWDALWERTHKKNADRILSTVTELEGLWIKFGQYLSTRADVLPDAYISSFRQLQDSLAPRPLSEVYETLEKELGSSPKDLFMDFDDKPLATASIAQVHRARMKDGRDVVVKVQHQGIKECLLQDLDNARKIVEWVAWAEPEYNFGPVIDEWCREVPKELNFNLEAENTRKVAHNLKSSRSPVDVLIPEVVQSSEKVLILTFMEGVKLSDVAALDSMGANKQAIVETITRAYAHQIYIDGLFNADPHPGNFLVSTDPPFRPILLDFGLTKSITPTLKKALAKMLLAAAEGDYAALLSAFSEMGLKLNLDMPEEAMEITSFFFRTSQPAKESLEQVQARVKESDERMQRIRAKMSEGGKQTHRSPVSAFPSDAVFFTRVLSLLRGLSSMLDAKVDYMSIMRPYAEATLWSQSGNEELLIYDSPLHSHAEQSLHRLLQRMAKEHRILGIQVCAYKDGKVIIDTSAGVLGKFDPRPVQPDSLFPVFSATKGVTAGLVHWLANQGVLSLDETVARIWPAFAANGKELCTVAHVLNHTAGLHNAGYDVLKTDPLIMCKWDEMLEKIAAAVPESPPGRVQKYHSLSYGWLCGGIVEKSSGRKFQELLEEAFVEPLGVSGEFYIGIAPGVENRLATLTLDSDAAGFFTNLERSGNLPSVLKSSEERQPEEGAEAREGPAPDSRATAALTSLVNEGGMPLTLSGLPNLFNMLFIRRAVIPAANGHFSARALARFYAMLANEGRVPPNSSVTSPALGSHPQHPSSPTAAKKKNQQEQKPSRRNCCYTRTTSSDTSNRVNRSEAAAAAAAAAAGSDAVFTSSDMYDAFLGTGKYEHLVVEGDLFGLGFRKLRTGAAGVVPFGHSGIGGSFGYCDPENDFAMAVTVNKMSFGSLTAEIVRLVCEEIGVPCPLQYMRTNYAPSVDESVEAAAS